MKNLFILKSNLRETLYITYNNFFDMQKNKYYELLHDEVYRYQGNVVDINHFDSVYKLHIDNIINDL